MHGNRLNRFVNHMRLTHTYNKHNYICHPSSTYQRQQTFCNSITTTPTNTNTPSYPPIVSSASGVNQNWNATDIIIEDYTKNSSGLVVLSLNRVSSLNALTLDMILTLKNSLNVLKCSAKCFLLKSNSPNGLSAGGDVKSLLEADKNTVLRFFGSEYHLNYIIANIEVPYIAIMNGIVMGGGCGLSIHGRYRIATASTIIAMPETLIGLVPDIGSSSLLSKMGSVGLYLGLTGARMNAADAIKLKWCTHYVPPESLSSMENELINANFGENPYKVVEEILNKYHNPEALSLIEPFFSNEVLESVEDIFLNNSSLQELIQKLENRSDEFSRKTLEAIRKNCPLACCVWFRQFEMSKNLDLLGALKLEFLLVQSFVLTDPNFKTGVISRLINKSVERPEWTPECIENVSDDLVQRMFDCPDGVSLEKITNFAV